MIRVEEPCDQSWDEMAPCGENQRHCAACDLVVHDLSNASRDEVLALLSRGGRVCGQLRVDSQRRAVFPVLAAAAALSTPVVAFADGNTPVVELADVVVPDDVENAESKNTDADHAASGDVVVGLEVTPHDYTMMRGQIALFPLPPTSTTPVTTPAVTNGK